MKNANSLFWVIVTFAGFLLFLLCFYWFVKHNIHTNISLQLYFVLVIFFALLATAFLAGAMRSVSRFDFKTQNRSLYLSGPAVIFFIILYIGYKYRPIPSAAPLTLALLFFENGNVVKRISEGQVNIKIGLYFSTKKIGEDGSVLFTGIDPGYKGKMIDISVDVPGYSLSTDSTYHLSDTDQDSQYNIRLIKNHDSVLVKGRVILLPERIGIPSVTIQFEKADKPITTSADGSFSIIIPVKSGTELRVIAIHDRKEIYNSLVNVYDKQLLSLGVAKQ